MSVDDENKDPQGARASHLLVPYERAVRMLGKFTKNLGELLCL